ncbi:valine-tRNA ligase Vrs2/Vas2 [Schizosaccharomyces japonicus yFS275]|uniref:valine--tRNA ligase n=1 Tax=Schizosaccharomyces japonicus (strain yFS275 / FY16936) TaxID=402676 RepID=B6K2F9_SCHJY|nr:valine-tRNA ligase Vrs2/Vas2 [Schizosaccharomyces japonicus yFS275]EEB07340.1 valine-tRNA ligase Vrs2/Vas2 [Schizosaccharomyces japonicus yFS275]
MFSRCFRHFHTHQIYRTAKLKPYQASYIESAYAYVLKQKANASSHYQEQNSLSDDDEVVLLPPPNITGKLHIGHALTIAIQDAICRYMRMSGKKVRFIPGMDHAGIATQSVIEQNLERIGSRPRELSRSSLLEYAKTWEAGYRAKIKEQLQSMAAIFDWSQMYYTLDEIRSEAVVDAFVRLHEQGLIYRKSRFVNWSCKLQSVISDIEVTHMDVKHGQTYTFGDTNVPIGYMYNIAYPLTDSSDGYIVVSTTRPETMFGDVAIAVNPMDSRYTQFIGKYVYHPFDLTVQLPIIGDIAVDPDFGTGAMKVTPSHSAVDFEIACRHNLRQKQSIAYDGTLMNVPVMFVGMDRLAARVPLVEQLQSMGLLLLVKEHEQTLSFCSRTGDLIEPFLLPQWYIHMQPLGNQVLSLMQTQPLDIQPSKFLKQWTQHLNSMQDWCVSRQIWWGHRIPAYQVLGTDEWVAARNLSEALEKSNGRPVQQDLDTLDTWFSSALLPISIFSWPHCKSSIPPLALIESGSDILFFWIVRMATLCSHFTNKIPFKKIALHPLLRDAEGRKMSKSLGNVIDPTDVVQGTTSEKMVQQLRSSNLTKRERENSIRQLRLKYPNGLRPYGLDALRFGLLRVLRKEHNLNVDTQDFEYAHLFVTKLWNIFRFVSIHYSQTKEPTFKGQTTYPVLIRGLRSKIGRLLKSCNDAFSANKPQDAIPALYDILVNDICNSYVTLSRAAFLNESEEKQILYVSFLNKALKVILNVAHPLIPQITEVLHSIFEPNDPMLLVDHPFPKPDFLAYPIDEQAEQVVTEAMNLAKVLRRLLKEENIQQSSKDASIYVETDLSALSQFQTDLEIGCHCRLFFGNLKAENDLAFGKLVVSSQTVLRYRLSRKTLSSSVNVENQLCKIHDRLATVEKRISKLDKNKTPLHIQEREIAIREELLAMLHKLRPE